MYSDQEVVREPFEDSQEVASDTSSSHQFKYDEQLEATRGLNELSDEREIARGQAISDDEDDGSSCADADDINFAKSFGITLKSSKTQQSAYKRLMNSDQFQSGQSELASFRHERPKPLIKTSITSDCIYHKGTFYQKGDIVALCDQDDGRMYFAQLTGFLQDQYCEKSASISWLVPTRPTSREFFDPSAYKIGLEDVQLRKLDCMTFVRHCPHDYYIRKFFKTPSSNRDDQEQRVDASYSKDDRGHAYIWMTMEPCSVPTIETNIN